MATAETHEKGVAPPGAVGARPKRSQGLVEVVLRFLLFASALVAVILMVTSKQTEKVQLPIPPFPVVSRPAKFNHSPAFIYFVAALSVAGLYAIISTLVALFRVLKPGRFPRVSSHLVILDVLLLGIVASATGVSGGVAYIGLKGNSHVGWRKVCDVYNKFCRHVGASVALSLLAAIILTLLVLLSVRSLSRRIPK